MSKKKEMRQCNNCGEAWVCTGDDICRFCGSDDTEPIEDEEADAAVGGKEGERSPSFI